MFSNVTVGFLAGAGIGAWVYSKMYHRNGGQSKPALVAGATAGVAAWVLMVLIMGAVTKS